MISRLAFCIALTCSLPLALHAQSTEDAIRARLKDKPLYLRGFWGNNKLSFDSTGHLIGKSSPVSFTLAGFNLERVRLQRGRLILDGGRMGLEFPHGKPQRVPLEQIMHIEIATNADGDYGPALDAIFVDGLADLTPMVPFYWSKFAHEHFAHDDFAVSDKSVTALPHANGGADPQKRPFPILLTDTEPQPTESARALSYGGVCTIRITVRPDGAVADPVVVTPLGLGLDENAIVAGLHSTFKPAMQDGQPIASEMQIQFKF